MDNGRGMGPRRRTQVDREYIARRREMARRREQQRRRRNAIRLTVVGVCLLLLVLAVVLILGKCSGKDGSKGTADPSASTAPTSQQGTATNNKDTEPSDSGMAAPAPVDKTRPSVLGIEQNIHVNGEGVDSYDRKDKINFGAGAAYTTLKGITTFRGNNYRDMTTYGTATVSEKKLEIAWTESTGNLGKWGGNGWTGQPLIVQWPAETRKIMNLKDEYKNDDNLVEVIYASMDGKVYFRDLNTGKQTRESVNLNSPFKGVGTIDPRGYPLLYLGSGDKPSGTDAEEPKAFIVSLIDGKILSTFGEKDAFSQRPDWTAYDAAPLVDADADTLIYPGENGVIYTIKLNTNYDEAAGTISIKPETVKMRYTNKRHRDSLVEVTDEKTGEKTKKATAYWLGVEGSPVIWKNYMYTVDNCGDMVCTDLNTMKIIWAQDTKDDTNGTPVLEIEEDGQGYLYVGTSLHWTKDSSSQGVTPFYKINASTGEVKWKVDYDVHTVTDVSGGIQATALVGKNKIKDLVIVPVARMPKASEGVLVALNKSDGSEKWRVKLETVGDKGGFAWSSPIAIYDEEGNAYIIQCNTAGRMYLIEGETGKVLQILDVSERTLEATPTAYGNMIVVGSRDNKTFGIRIK